MNLLVVGGGGREHAIIKKVKENPAVETVYALPGNGGIAADAVCVPEIGAKDIGAIVDFARAHAVDFAVVAPRSGPRISAPLWILPGPTPWTSP